MAPDVGNLHLMASATATLQEDSRAPNIVFGDPQNRKVKVIGIGAGIGGISVAYNIKRFCSNVDLVVYERQADIGGVWQANQFPNARCDIPSLNYSFPFAPKFDWKENYSDRNDIQAYMRAVCDQLDLTKSFSLSSNVLDCTWDDVSGQWQVTVEHDGKVLIDRCDILVAATGVLSTPKVPDVPGLGQFKGKMLHTAQWPQDYRETQWSEDNIAVVGLGASALQTIPGLQQHAKHIDLFARTGLWFVSGLEDYDGTARSMTVEEHDAFRTDPSSHIEKTKGFEDEFSDRFVKAFMAPPAVQTKIAQGLSRRLADRVSDERLFNGLKPNYPIGCRRPGYADPCLRAIQQENVDVHFTGVGHLTEDGVVGEDGAERKVDTIVWATGFTNNFIPPFAITGRDGVKLSEVWQKYPKAYMGMTIPGFPNFISLSGPNYPVAVGGVQGAFEAMARYVVQMVKKMQEEDIKAFEPRTSAMEAFDVWAQDQLHHTTFSLCNSHHSQLRIGRINAWPGTIPHFRRAIRIPRYEDYEITYRAPYGQFAYLGRGISPEHSAQAAAAGVALDKSPYFSMRNVDPDWLAHTSGMSREAAREKILDDIASEARARAERLLHLQAHGDGGSMLINEAFRMP